MQIKDLFNSDKKLSKGTGTEQDPGELSLNEPVMGKDPVPETKQNTMLKIPDSGFRNYFRGLKRKETTFVVEYDFELHGTLVEAQIPAGYEEIDRYWVEKGRSLVVIALNNKTDQEEYLLSEPALSEFEYELLERLHEDLRDILILSSDEIKKDPRRVLLDKIQGLIED